jgi:hypothetical protein
MEPAPDAFDPTHLDWQVEAAERAGKQVILAVGAVKNFGYPEFFVPKHRLPAPLPEGTLVSEASPPELLEAAVGFVAKVVERYRGRASVIAWQVEHEAVDPLGVEHSWRLATGFVKREMAEVRRLDPGRPILLNGFLPIRAIAPMVATRDQGDRWLAEAPGVSAWTFARAARWNRRWIDRLDGDTRGRGAPAQRSNRRRPAGGVMISEGAG